ncbi:MAG: molybdate ABC transporter permease subunit [Planctomycetia bacterium]|uniref:Molybdenum transport system permease n=1 Tax=Candidatus Brocadia sapporoensis TaxID=392547 RepID=A0A1V6M1T4_9BACT|nr:molybdate ABC transporter permease subunit [Candidatus Brocadia sapporoensis]MCC7238867.1 molybdate ABC transporter permease subunit [Candidatus Brocadia sp.]QOJ07450.1 MAG: molybdate ABC transporter permease subunit [Planctomycetia bacterium]TVL97537.1 MAG: molybdate ABC transporter permease subunit [Candidatus Brocadia sp. BL1]MDG6006470.1 molybdate ABC transporter permease subunit [Candidatus Brocadia sp.]OQD46352.1 molybdenum ABC transporter permease subunit [Candidatus Brocadia sapporo
MNFAAPFLLTLKLATITTLFLFVLGIPFAYWLAFSKLRLKFIVESVTALPLVLPPTVLGFYILMAIGANGFAGRWYAGVFHKTLAFSFQGLVVGSFIYNLPFAIRPFQLAFIGVDKKLLEASWSLGRSKFYTFLFVIFPLSRQGIITGCILSFAHCVGEFGVVLMIGGNIPGVTRVASVAIYDEVQALNYGTANIYAAILLAFSFIILTIVYFINRRFFMRMF